MLMSTIDHKVVTHYICYLILRMQNAIIKMRKLISPCELMRGYV